MHCAGTQQAGTALKADGSLLEIRHRGKPPGVVRSKEGSCPDGRRFLFHKHADINLSSIGLSCLAFCIGKP